MQFIPYDRKLRDAARALRRNSTEAEIILWSYLRGRMMLGYKFNRQRPVDHYIIDFYCTELKLAIEVDGEVHNYQGIDDELRQTRLESFGIIFLRFTNDQVKKDLRFVLEAIRNHVSSLSGERLSLRGRGV
jgi:very-short-patch-repair endonuclease